MSELAPPHAARPLLAFAPVLRAHGFAAAPDQSAGFVAAVGLLGPRRMEDLRRAAHALFAPEPERLDDFNAVFDLHFLGRVLAAPAAAGDDDEITITEPRDGAAPPPEEGELSESGGTAAELERLAGRAFADDGESEAIRRLAREAPRALPRRRARRRRPSRRGDRIDLPGALRRAVRTGGDIVALPRLKQSEPQRRVLLLIDVSGSMKAQTDWSLRLAHVLVRRAERAEVFTFGTRLTRVTPALRLVRAEAALARAGRLVADWDGGTRIGDALGAFLSVPRFAGLARGAAVVVVSDGLERGEPDAMVEAVARLRRLAWRLDWLTPLAADPDFEPRTAALMGAMAHLHALGDGSTPAAVAGHLLGLGRR